MERTCKHLFKYLSPPTSRKTVSRVKMCGEGRLHMLTMFVWSHVCNVSVDVKLSKLTNQRVTRSWYNEMRCWKQCLQASLPCLIPANPPPPPPLRREVFAQLFSESRTGYYNTTVRFHDKVAATSVPDHRSPFSYHSGGKRSEEWSKQGREDFQCSIFFTIIKEVYGRQRTHYRKEALTWNVHSQCILMGHSSAPSVNNKIKRGRLFQSFLFKGSERAGLWEEKSCSRYLKRSDA